MKGLCFPTLFEKNPVLQPYCIQLSDKFGPVRQIFAFVLSVYIAFAACCPCSDDGQCADDGAASIAAITSGAHHHSTNEADQCSPFCICSCCSTSIQQPPYLSFVFFFPEGSAVYLEAKPHPVATIAHAIWQPPRLV
jgi:hypothetical protein